MAKVKLPAYVSPRKLAGGVVAYWWVRPSWADPKLAASKLADVRRRAIRHGKTCPLITTPLGSDLSEVHAKGEALNIAFKEWREGSDSKDVVGTVDWLFTWYRGQTKFLKNSHKTREGYALAMQYVTQMAMKTGRLGTRVAGKIDGPAADTLYERAREKHGVRQASYMMQVCRLVWNHARRPGYSATTGVKENPFAGMSIEASSGTGKGNLEATREQYNAYRAAAHELGLQSLAVAAALCFECCQRVTDVFGYEDPDDRIVRGIFWDKYIPGKEISLIQSKTKKLIQLPLSMEVNGETVPLYPELEEELGRLERKPGQMIVLRELDGKPYPEDFMPKKHRLVREKAKLPKALHMTGFRHGGLTEIGNADVQDMRAVSGHTKVETTSIYNKANVEKARMIAAQRRAHIKFLAGDSAEIEKGDEA